MLRRLLAFLKEPANIFVAEVLVVYGLWKISHHLLQTGSGAIQLWWSSFIFSTGSVYAAVSVFILKLFGQPVVHNGIDILFTDSGRVVWVQEHCLAIPAMVMFTAAIILYGNNYKGKIWFIPVGLISVAIINVLRLIFLSLTFQYMSQRFFEINHSLIYVVITYALIMVLIWWWMKSFAYVNTEA